MENLKSPGTQPSRGDFQANGKPSLLYNQLESARAEFIGK